MPRREQKKQVQGDYEQKQDFVIPKPKPWVVHPLELCQLASQIRLELQSTNRDFSLSLYGDGGFVLKVRTASKRTYLWDFCGTHDAKDSWMRIAEALKEAPVYVGSASGGGPAFAQLPNRVCTTIASFCPFAVTLNVEEAHGKGHNWQFVLPMEEKVKISPDPTGCALMMPGWRHNPNDKSNFDFEYGRLRLFGLVVRRRRTKIRLTRKKDNGRRTNRSIPLGRPSSRAHRQGANRAEYYIERSAFSCLDPPALG